MTDHTPQTTTPEESAAEARLADLVRDLGTLQAYLEERGRHTYDLAQRFLGNARRDAGSRAYDERQATMLEYQHYIWHEIAGRLNQLIIAYGEPEVDHDHDHTQDQDVGDTATTTPGER